MTRKILALGLAVLAAPALAQAAQPDAVAAGHYLFVWAGDRAHQGNDFLVVIDADPASGSYGRIVTSLATDQQSVRVHHTEYTMPASGMLFANDHDAGPTFIVDLRDPLPPKVPPSSPDIAASLHPPPPLPLPLG